MGSRSAAIQNFAACLTIKALTKDMDLLESQNYKKYESFHFISYFYVVNQFFYYIFIIIAYTVSDSHLGLS